MSFPARIFSIPFQEIKKIIFYHPTFEEYKKYKKEAELLKARVVGLEEVLQENARLEDLLGFKRKLIYSSVAARVIGREPSSWNSSLMIDKGIEEGIAEGQPVVNHFGVIGRITEAGKRQAKVILLTDPQFSVAALVQRPRENGILSGTLQGLCRLRYLDENSQIREGDQVMTSKLSSSFPEGLLIGEITRVLKNPAAPAVEAVVRPAVSLSQIEEVLVIIK